MENISFLEELEARLNKLESELNISNSYYKADPEINHLVNKIDSAIDSYFEPKMELFEPSKKRYIDY
jgi:hypothetical protein